MCRHIAYWGPAISPADLALDAPHSLLAQCTGAHEMSWGRENLDGWGAAWSGPESSGSLRSHRPLPDDHFGQHRLRSAHADRFIVHVRQKTPGSATDGLNSAPFTDGPDRYFTHNGYVADFRNGVREELLAKVSPIRADWILGDTDSEVLFALVLDRLDAGAAPSEAIGAVAEVAELYGGRYNILLWARDQLVATRWDNSLYVRDGDAVIVTSEPLDGGPWEPVPERSMAILTADGLRLEDM